MAGGREARIENARRGCERAGRGSPSAKDECLCFQLAFKVMAGEPAAFSSRAARRPQSAAESERSTAKGGNHKQAEDDGEEYHKRRVLRGTLTLQTGAMDHASSRCSFGSSRSQHSGDRNAHQSAVRGDLPQGRCPRDGESCAFRFPLSPFPRGSWGREKRPEDRPDHLRSTFRGSVEATLSIVG